LAGCLSNHGIGYSQCEAVCNLHREVIWMRRLNLTACILTAAFVGTSLIGIALMSGCGGGSGRPTSATPTGSITGRLVTGGGKSRVVVSAAIMGAQTVTPQVTFDGDRFRIDNVPAGEQVVCIREQDGMRGAMFVALVFPNKVTDVGNVEVEQLGKVSGFVYEVDEDGNRVKPIADAKVTARAIGVGDEGDQLGEISRSVFSMTKTDREGSYELFLPEGEYLIEACAPGYQPAMDTVVVEPLTTVACDLGLRSIPKENLGAVHGKVTANLEGQLVPVAGAIVVLTAMGEPQPPEPIFEIQPITLLGMFPNQLAKGGKKQIVVPPAWGRMRIAFTDAEGNYRIDDVKPGEYRAVAFKEGYGSDEKNVKVKPGESVRVDFELSAKFGIVQGRVSDAETKQPIEGAIVTATVFGDPYLDWDNWVRVPGEVVALVHVHHVKRKVGQAGAPGFRPIEPIRPPKLPPIKPPVRASAISDENGFYKLVLPEGEYFITAWKDGYVPEGTIVEVVANQTVTQDFELTKLQLGLTIDLELPEQVSVGEPVKMRLILRNEGSEPVRLRFRTGQRYDFIVRNLDGDVIWQWSHGKAFTQAIGEMEIPPGGERSFDEEWDQVDNDGKRVDAGEYEVEGIITSEAPMAVAKSLVIGSLGGGGVAPEGKGASKR